MDRQGGPRREPLDDRELQSRNGSSFGDNRTDTVSAAMIDNDQERRLEAFLQSLSDVAWVANAGLPSTKYHVAADAVVAWDDWNAAMLSVWLPRSERLEALAIAAIGDPAIESIFHRVDSAIEPSVHAAVRAYFARRPDTTENTECGADRALRPEIVGFVLRDMSWAAVETALGQPGFFVSLVPVHREGRWPCAWEGRYPEGCFVVL